MKISLIIPYYPVVGKEESVLEECVKSINGYDELILVVNDGIGYGAAVNRGLKLAKGDYLMIANDDIILDRGDIRSLCEPDAVTCPQINNEHKDFNGGLFCIPRAVYEKVGGFDEQFKIGYFEDDDYIMRLRANGIPMRCHYDVHIKHEHGGMTMHKMENKYDENQKKFFDKWGVLSSNEN